MDKGLLKNALIFFLLAIAGFCLFKYAGILQEKQVLSKNLHSLEIKLAALEEEKRALHAELGQAKQQAQLYSQEKALLRDNLEAARKRMAGLFSKLTQTEKAIERINAKFLLLKAQNSALIVRSEKFNALAQENERLKQNLNSIPELKRRIRELKNRPLAGQVLPGNRGFVIKDGQPTLPAKVKIEVAPVAGEDENNR